LTTQGHFYAEIRTGTERLKREIGYNPSYFNLMVAEYGPIEATRRLITAGTVSEGFTKLWEHDRLAMSVEALAILPWYSPLFDSGMISRARQRLEEHCFDVDGYLVTRTASPPSWWHAAGGA
jgi:hypothetical protein